MRINTLIWPIDIFLNKRLLIEQNWLGLKVPIPSIVGMTWLILRMALTTPGTVKIMKEFEIFSCISLKCPTCCRCYTAPF